MIDKDWRDGAQDVILRGYVQGTQERIVLGGRGTHRVLSVEGGTEVALTGFIITDGLAAGDVGGCILTVRRAYRA